MDTTLSVQEAATLLKVTSETVRRQIRQKKLKAEKVNGEWRISREGVLNATSNTHTTGDETVNTPNTTQYNASNTTDSNDTPNAHVSGTFSAGMAASQAIQQAVSQALAPVITQLAATLEENRKLNEQLKDSEIKATKAEVELHILKDNPPSQKLDITDITELKAEMERQANESRRYEEERDQKIVERMKELLGSHQQQRRPWWKLL